MRATVYLAFSAALDRHVALKVSHLSDDTEPQFAREFEAVGALRDPAVVDIYDYGVHEGREFIAMEYFPCGDLKTRLLNPISMEESLQYLERIARALCVVHARGLVHRDLKPPNIMLRESGEVVLIDFGIAKNLEHGAGSTRTGVLRGSPYYMSPEQAQGAELDARSDLYSLGVIFYEMLTGAKPYIATTAMEVLQQHVDRDIPSLAARHASCQPLLESLMAKDRNQRFASAHALLESIHGAAA
jgi:serine/threonine-protein kinase PpkA